MLKKIFEKFLSMKLEIKKFVLSRILGKKYIREGKCKRCGRCCQSIYVRHSLNIIKEEEEFNKLKDKHFFYSWLKVIGKDEMGLIFECTKLDKEKGTCTVHKQRALICRQYPVEEIFEMGGFVGEECGYSFVPIRSFAKVLEKVQKENR